MNQAVGVDQLDGGGRGVQNLDRSAAGFTRQIDQNRTQALAAPEHAVAHRLAQRRGRRVGYAEGVLEHALDPRAILGQTRRERLAAPRAQAWGESSAKSSMPPLSPRCNSPCPRCWAAASAA